MDMGNDKRGYIAGVKHLQWKMIKYVPKTVRNAIKLCEEELIKKRKDIANLNLTSEQKQKKLIDAEYQIYNVVCEYMTKVIAFSPIIVEEITGILETGNDIKDIERLNDMIRKETIDNIMVMERGEIEEGMEEDASGSQE